MKNCAFCDREVIQNQAYWETPNGYVLRSFIPITPGHSIVFPKKHFEKIEQMSNDDIASLFATVRDVAVKLQKIFDSEGVNYAWNEGDAFGQKVPHVHIHIIPRKVGDTGVDVRGQFYRPGPRTKVTDEEITKMRDWLHKKFVNFTD